MIPKKIHYCWFGRNPKSELALKCIESWKQKLPDYEMIEWNEDTFDINENVFCKEAYEAKKWAFVTDYVRLKVLYEYGGIYMDTDVEVLDSLEDFLSNRAFSGFEDNCSVPTGIMASEAKHPFFAELLAYYNNRHFTLEDGTYDVTTNVQIITETASNKGLRLDNTMQVVEDFAFYPNDYFCPMSWKTRKLNITKNTKTIHHFAGSWLSEDIRKSNKRYQFVVRLFGEKVADFLLNLKNIISRK
ncbi:MAG: glycosyl transferase [Lachnospiraceae bacterium]|nr:glycosyl transferase [Lachnospiraceae bacterium]